MKKLLGILVLGLLWCNVGFAEMRLIEKNKIKSLIYDPCEWSVAKFKEFKEKTPINLKPKNNFLLIKRAKKTQDELKKIRTSANINKECFKTFADSIS